MHNCINLLILITHLNCYELNACIVLAFYIFGYYHYIKQGPTVIGHWSVFKVPSIPLSNLCWKSPITNDAAATSKVSTNHVDTDYLARRHDPGFFL